MKKSLLVLALIVTFAASSFASVSFLTASPVGQGQWSVLGLYGTNHNGNIANNQMAPGLDATSMGVRGAYGIMKDLDLLVAYTQDTLPNIKDIFAGKQASANTTSIGIKYAIAQNMLPVDMAVVLGNESSAVAIKLDAGGTGNMTSTAMGLGCVVSKQTGNIVTYGGVAYKTLSFSVDKKLVGADVSAPGTGLAFNVGCAIGIAENQAILVEYNTENQSFAEVKKGGVVQSAEYGNNVSGISLGYAYMF